MQQLLKIELGGGTQPTASFVHRDKLMHCNQVDVAHDHDFMPWPWNEYSCNEILALDIFEHLHVMPEHWLRKCNDVLALGGVQELLPEVWL